MKATTNIIVDCNYICWSSSFALPQLSKEDQQVAIIFGFLQQILSLAKKHQTNKFYFCWDSRKSYRRLIFPDYKRKRRDSRKEISEEDLNRIKEIYSQISELREFTLPKIGFNNSFIKTGYEADDLICHLSRRLKGSKIIVSSDEDLYQLLNDDVSMYSIRKGKIFGTENLRKKYNVTPEEWIQIKALAGCKSDEIPGISGVGIIKAEKYIHNRMKESSTIKKRIDSDDGRRIYQRNLELVELPLHGNRSDISDQITEDHISRGSLTSIFEHYWFKSFLKTHRLQEWVEIFVK